MVQYAQQKRGTHQYISQQFRVNSTLKLNEQTQSVVMQRKYQILQNGREKGNSFE
jgi:hypothetical protein